MDLGDSPEGMGEKWVRRAWAKEAVGEKRRGDGTREELERIARETGIFFVTGLVERAGGTLYCSAVYVCPNLGGKFFHHRQLYQYCCRATTYTFPESQRLHSPIY